MHTIRASITSGVLLSLLLGYAPQAPQQPSAAAGNIQRFLNVKVYRLRVTWGASEHWKKTEGDTTTQHDLDIAATATYRLLKSDDSNPRTYQWRIAEEAIPTGMVTVVYAEKRVTKQQDGKENWTLTTYKCGSAPAGGEGRADIDTEPKSYRVFAYAKSAPGTMEVSSSEGGKFATRTPFTLSTYMTMVPSDDIGQLPPSGMVIKSEPKIGDKPLPLGIVRNMSVQWELAPWDLDPLQDPQIDVADHAWLPEPGKSCQVTIKWKGEAREVRATLAGISHEPGTCLNSPSTDKGPDMLLKGGNGWTVIVDGSPPNESYTAILTQPKGTSATLPVYSEDYGGWARLSVKVEAGGAVKDAKAPTGRASIIVPWDANENHVADQWEADNGVEGVPASTDDDGKPEGNGFVGDGLTIYEEYRGFLEDGKHIRTDPRVKDVFYSDQTATASGAGGGTNGCAKEGLALFESITKLKVHGKLTAAELSPSRVINRNHGEGPHEVDQHGVPIIADPNAAASEAKAAFAGASFGPPKQTSVIVLSPGKRLGMEDGFRGNSKYTENADAFISNAAHELCHSVGVRHHGDSIVFVVWRFRKGPDGVERLYEQAYADDGFAAKSGGEAPIRAFREQDNVELTQAVAASSPPGGWSDVLGGYQLVLAGQGSEYSGPADCVMRYLDADAYRATSSPTIRFIPDRSSYIARHSLCSSKEGTEINASSHHPQSRYGDAARGICSKQIVINDKYSVK